MISPPQLRAAVCAGLPSAQIAAPHTATLQTCPAEVATDGQTAAERLPHRMKMTQCAMHRNDLVVQCSSNTVWTAAT